MVSKLDFTFLFNGPFFFLRYSLFVTYVIGALLVRCSCVTRALLNLYAIYILHGGFSLVRFCAAAMLHGRNNRLFFLWENKFFLMQNIFIVPVMQHGCRAKPLLND